MKMLLLDFETRSRCDLKARGTDNYAYDPSTEILCCGFGMYGEGQENVVWYPGEPLPEWVSDWVLGEGLIAAHNARFDALVWENAGPRAGLPMVDPERWYCTSAQCRINALPASLDDAAIALKLKHRKDFKGTALIKKLSIPQADGQFLEDHTLLKQMGDYCLQDVKVMHAVMRSTRMMTSDEHKDWLVNETINDNGIKVDAYLAELAISYADEEQKDISAGLIHTTSNAVSKHTQNARAKEWILARLPKHLITFMTKYVKNEKKYTLDKSSRAALLDQVDLPPAIRLVIELVDAGNKSSVAKFKQMINRKDDGDDRVRGAFVYAGASQTLRFASRGLQLHNMTRECLSPADTENLIDKMEAKRPIATDDIDTMKMLSMALRPALVPAEGKVFVVGDWSAIEARALPWLANSRESNKVLQVFRDGKDIYTETANGMCIKERQIGKVATLALGFAGGVGAFDAMAKNYGVYLSDTKKQEVVDKWRLSNKWAVRFWAQLEAAAFAAMRNPGLVQKAGRVSYVFAPSLIEGTLICVLPSGQMIQYPAARIELLAPGYDLSAPPVPTLTALKANWTKSPTDKEWPRVSLWKGLLVENICQATCADLLRCTLRELHTTKYKVVGHVHDEVVCEVYTKFADETKSFLQQTMETPPEWAEGLPLDAEPEVMLRYGK